MESNNTELQESAENRHAGHECHHHHKHHHHREEVSVTVDSKQLKVPEGTYMVSEFKKLVGVPPSKELDQVKHGELVPLDDNSEIHVKCGEVFISHARQGGSS